MSSTNIAPSFTSELIESFALMPERKVTFSGCCYLTLERGSFEMTQIQDKDLEISCQGYPGDQYFQDLKLRNKFVCFVKTPHFSIKSGNQGCTFSLYRPSVELKH